jgi:hypothetical protein
MSMIPSPAASAASRATFPALWPWRTIHNRSGHLCLMAETKRERRESSEQAVGLQPDSKVVRVNEEMCMHADRTSAFDVDLAIVDKQGLVRPQAEAVECEKIDGRIGLQQTLLAGNDDVAEAAEEGFLIGAKGRPEIG